MFARKGLCEADLTCAARIADMPDVAAGSLSIAFGDFRRGDLIVDCQGVRVLRDPTSAKPYVLFYTTKRVGGRRTGR
jgi:HK97 family phage major capsid protein